MNMQSPMLAHSIESFQHGIEHYLDGTPKSRKFAILHLDHSIELIIKEKVALCGKSIYKQDGQTLSLHEALTSLEKENIILVEKPRIQEIHDLRNTVQHKGLTPDEYTTQFYIDIAYKFFKRFAIEILNLDFNNIIPQKYINMMEGCPQYLLPDIRDDMKIIHDIESPVEKIVKAYTVLEQVAAVVQDPEKGIKGFRQGIRKIAIDKGMRKEQVDIYLDSIQKLRNKVVHSDYYPSSEETFKYVNQIGKLLRLIGAFEKKEPSLSN